MGGQEIAHKALEIISEIYDLLSSFDFEISKIQELRREKKEKEAFLRELNKKMKGPDNLKGRKDIQDLIQKTEEEIAKYNREVKELENFASTGISETSSALRKQVLSQIQLKLSLLGVVPSSNEALLLKSDSSSNIREGISSLLARATQGGQYGFRAAVFEAGYSDLQRKWISLYRTIRNDVKVVSLATERVFVRPTSLTSTSDSPDEADHFIGEAQIINAPRLFLAVNGNSKGTCGNSKSCVVSLEYTWLGATMAAASMSGSIIMPVYFEADVKFKEPDFEGSVSCDFENGFTVQGRADVKDGLIIYDGDINNQIKVNDLEKGACTYNIKNGDADSAAYHAIKYLYEHYMTLKMERAKKSRAEMERYKHYIDEELKIHAEKSSSKEDNFEFWSFETWTTIFSGFWGTATQVVNNARNFYWHTRIEDSKISETVTFETSIIEKDIIKNSRLAFDGFTILCWKKVQENTVLSACPSNDLPNYINKADTDLGKNEQQCGNSINPECLKSLTEINKNPQVDDNGVVADPWA